MNGQAPQAEKVDRQALILRAVVDLLAHRGISAVSMRAVAREAGVSLGLVNYHFADKRSLVSAALRLVEQQDLDLLSLDEDLAPEQRLRAALRRIAEPAFLTTDYLSLRLQLWSLARADAEFEEINATAQQRYRDGLAGLIRAARPGLTAAQARQRAADINVIQNGIWLTALLGLDRASVRRGVAQTEEVAFRD